MAFDDVNLNVPRRAASVAAAIVVVVVGGALVSADTSNHGLGEVAGVAACHRDTGDGVLAIHISPGQPRCSCAQHQLFLSLDQPECLQKPQATVQQLLSLVHFPRFLQLSRQLLKPAAQS